MSRRLLPILLLLALWLIICSIFLGRWFCNIGAAAAAAPAEKDRLYINDGSAFNTRAAEHFDFNRSSYNYLPLDTEVNSSIKQTADYLKANPERSLVITGLYLSLIHI